MTMSVVDAHSLIRTIPDFPTKGIAFKDLSDILSTPAALDAVKREVISHYKTIPITKVVGIESRGFILGGIIANSLGVGFVALRKAGKLPGDVCKCTFDMEYQKGVTIEVQKRQLGPDDVVLLHDDVLATGGTLLAAIELCETAGVKLENIYINILYEIKALKGRENVGQKCTRLFSVISE